MSARALLQACMYGLVLVNLVFVQMTQATSIGWLVPLYVLTLLAPLLAPLRAKLVYRALWNVSLLAVFAALGRHAMGEELRYVLQDGLLLAALCQVHLLNNLREDQPPDLLFLNSFLIALVTGFLSRDLAFSVAFVVFAPLLVVGLQLLCVTRGGGDVPRHATLQILRQGLARASVIVALTVLAFVAWPRDFHRKGFLQGELSFQASGGALEIGFTDELTVGKGALASASDEVVFRVTLERGGPLDVPELWRGATLGRTNGGEWRAFNNDGLAIAPDPLRWRRAVDEPVWMRLRDAEPGAGARVIVEHVDDSSEHLFAPLSADLLTLRDGLREHMLQIWPDGTLRRDGHRFARGPVGFRLGFEAEAPELGGATPTAVPDELAPYVELASTATTRDAAELARRATRGLDDDAEQHEIVARLRAHLESTRSYVAAGRPGAAATLREFLDGAGGHCELFASALATMLRSRGIACRVVTGYRSAEWDDAGKKLTVRRRHAHAWVEVLDPRGGWYAVDASPAPALDEGPSPWSRGVAALSDAWAELVSFNGGRRDEVLAWARTLPGRSWAWLRANPLSAALAGSALVLCLALARVRRLRGIPAEARRYALAVRRCGLALEPGETPRELLARARACRLPDARVAALRAATNEHERARYSSRAAAGRTIGRAAGRAATGART